LTLFSSPGSGGPYCALSTSFGRLQTECPQANMQYHLGYVDIRKKFFHHENTKDKKHEIYLYPFRVFVRSYFRDKFVFFGLGSFKVANIPF
jgi:hypothetical protein